jgi:integrase
MQHQGTLAVSGHVFCVKRKCGPQFYVKYRVGGTQIQKRLGPAWLDQGRPPPGHYTKQMAEAALAAILADARRGAALHSTSSAVTVSEAAHEWLRHSEWERGVKASTLREYRSVVDAHIVTRFGDQSIETVTARQVEAWAAELLASGRSRRTVNKILTMLHGVFECARRVWNLPSNPVAEVARRPERYSGDLDFFSPEEVMALVHAAQSEQDAAIFLTAAYTGLRRGELVALRWRDVLFDHEARRPFRSRGDPRACELQLWGAYDPEVREGAHRSDGARCGGGARKTRCRTSRWRRWPRLSWRGRGTPRRFGATTAVQGQRSSVLVYASFASMTSATAWDPSQSTSSRSSKSSRRWVTQT